MQLSEELASLFVKATRDEDDTNKETTVYGELVKVGDTKYVRIDGSDLLTPVTSTVAANDGERVVVTIRNHTATVTGNSSSPAARSGDVEDVSNQILQIDNTITQIDNRINQQDNTITQLHNSIEQQGNTITQIDNGITQIGNRILQQDNTISQQGNVISQINNDIVQQNTTISQMNTTIQQQDSTIKNVSSDLTTVKSDVTVNKSSVQILNSAFVIENGVLKRLDGIVVDDLKTNHLDTKYADIDFANIGEAAVGKIFADSGIIQDLVVEEGHITGELVGVTISGDLIKGNTIVAEKLVVKGNNGLYYKLNTDGMSVEAEQTEYNSLNGSVIAAKSITATKIDVSDLVAFNATIGGFHIGDHSLYSGVKQSASNTTRGIYMDDQGQFALGDSSNYLKYYKDTDSSYKLDVSAKSIKFGASGKNIEDEINDARKMATNYMWYGEGGLTIGNLTSNSLGKNVLIDSDSVYIRNGETVLARYGDNKIELGKNNEFSVIDLCNGLGQIRHSNSDEYRTWKRLGIEGRDSLDLESKVTSITAKYYKDYIFEDPATGDVIHSPFLQDYYSKISCESVEPWDPWTDINSIPEPTQLRFGSKMRLQVHNCYNDGSNMERENTYLSDTAIDLGAHGVSASMDIDDQTEYGCGEQHGLVQLCLRYGLRTPPPDGHIPSYTDNDRSSFEVYTDAVEIVTKYEPRINNHNVMLSDFKNNYYGLVLPDGTDSDWLRTTNKGVIPYVSGGSSSLGTITWPFNTVYSKTIYEDGTALSSKYASMYVKGATVTISGYLTGGYVTGGGTSLRLSFSLSRPIVSGASVTISNASFKVRQGGKYLFGSSSDSSVAPSSISVSIMGDRGTLAILATMSNSTNASNNDVAGIEANFKLTIT